MDQMMWTNFRPDELPTAIVGHDLQFFPSIGSTNDALKDAARAGADDGLVFVTDEQTAGRGRRGRGWTAPAGSSLLVSILLRPTWLPAQDGFYLTMLAAVAAAESIDQISGLTTDLKWPNDLLIDGRKCGGILVETEMIDERVRWAVIGCGVNCNWNPRTIAELADSATSLSAETGDLIERRALLQALLTDLDYHYTALRGGARSALFRAWRDRLTTLGQPVRADTPHGPIDGVAADVTTDGALVIRDNQGQTHTVTAGDVSIRAR